VLRITLPLVIGCLFYLPLALASVDSMDLRVCLAHSDRTSQISCCEEFEISKAECTAVNQKVPEAAESKPDKGSYFYCKFRNLDGSEEDIARWGKGTDFIFVPSKNMWEWHTEYAIQSIDSSGGYYQTALNPIFEDKIGRCGPEIEMEYKERLKAIKEEYRK
jgi:hypothetical protein